MLEHRMPRVTGAETIPENNKQVIVGHMEVNDQAASTPGLPEGAAPLEEGANTGATADTQGVGDSRRDPALGLWGAEAAWFGTLAPLWCYQEWASSSKVTRRSWAMVPFLTARLHCWSGTGPALA